MRVRLTSDPDGAIVLEATYREWDPVREHFKREIPYEGRRWDEVRKRWIISVLYTADLLQFLTQHGAQIQDDRTPVTSVAAVPPMPEDLREAFDALYLAYTAPLCVAEASFRALSKYFHPDRGGDPQQFHTVNDAIAVVRHYLDPRPEDPDANDIPF
jgi:hypothetical protein